MNWVRSEVNQWWLISGEIPQSHRGDLQWQPTGRDGLLKNPWICLGLPAAPPAEIDLTSTLECGPVMAPRTTSAVASAGMKALVDPYVELPPEPL